MAGLVDLIAPPRLGRNFRLQLSASWLGSLGSGMAQAAGPLLVATQTHDARLISLAALLDWLPSFVLSLWAGGLADRHDRRTLMLLGGAPRVVALAALVVMLASGHVAIWAVLVTMATMGIGDTFYFAAGRTILPMIVDRSDLGVANARLQFGWMGLQRLIAPMVGAALFALGMAWPFLTEFIVEALGFVLVAQLVLPPHGTAPEERPHLLADIREGLHWSWHNRAMRALNLQIVTFNIAYGAVWGTMVLYAHERLGLGSIGYGLLTAAAAVGGVIGSLTYGWTERHVRIADIMRYGLILETATWGVLAWTTHPWVALAILCLFGVHEGYWGATYSSVVQRAVPQELQGRVGSVYMMLLQGGLVVGAALSGQLSERWGLTAPYWFGFGCAGLVLVVLWRELGNIAHEDESIRDGLSPA